MTTKTFTIQKCTWLVIVVLSMYSFSCKESKTQPDKNNIPKEAMEFSMEEMKKDIYTNNHMVAYRHRDPEEKWRDKEKDQIIEVLNKFDTWLATESGYLRYYPERGKWNYENYKSRIRNDGQMKFSSMIETNLVRKVLEDSIIPSLAPSGLFADSLLEKVAKNFSSFGDSITIFTLFSGNESYLTQNYINLLVNEYKRGSLYNRHYLNDPSYYGENGEPFPTMDMKHAIFYYKQMIKLYTPTKALYKVKSQLVGSDYDSFVCIILDKDAEGNWKISDFIVPKPEELVEPKYKIDIEEYTTKPFIKG